MKNLKTRLTDYIAMKKKVDELKQTIDNIETELFYHNDTETDQMLEEKLNNAKIELDQLESELSDMEYELEVC